MSIVWLASYPKSGNTWCRAFLVNLLKEAQTPVSINAINYIPIASDRNLLETLTGIPSSNLTTDEITRLRFRVYEKIGSQSDERRYFKIHDAFASGIRDAALIPEEVTWGAIYIVRNPLDVAVSLAHHMGQRLDRILEEMSDEEYGIDLRQNRRGAQLPQHLRSWSSHVTSWLDAPGLHRHVVRYEDMQQHPGDVFTGIARFLKLRHDSESIRRAVRYSSFDELKKQELLHGFSEKSPQSDAFFRRGTVGSWRQVLTDIQVETLVQNHQDVMGRLDYLSPEGEIQC